MGSTDGAVVRAQASYHCGPGSIPGSGVIRGLSLLLVLSFVPRVFLRVLRFCSLHKNQHSKSQFDLYSVTEWPLCGCATSNSYLFYYLFIYFIINNILASSAGL